MKNSLKILLGVMVSLVVIMMASCEADKINRSADVKLSFSADSIFFDTVFTAQGSATRRLRVYNNCKNKVVISSVGIAQGVQFFMNVDGRKGKSFTDITMNAHDSMMVYVQVDVNPTDSKTPFTVMDSIIFMINGNEQKVYLEACGRNALRLHNHTLTSDTTITSDIPVLVFDTLRVPKGKTLTLAEGAQLFFRKWGVLVVDGTLVIEGSQSAPVVLRGERSDYMNTSPPLNYDMSSNQWGGIRFTKTSTGNNFKFANIRNTTFGLQIDSLENSANALDVESCWIYNSGGNLISSVNADVTITNTLLHSAGGYIIKHIGGNLTVSHTTIANYYSYSWGSREAPDIYLSAVTAKGTQITTDDRFYNTIIYGGYTSEIVVDKKEGDPITYLFKNSLVKIAEKNVDEYYVDCVVNGNPDFVFQGWDEAFRKANPHLYDFHLQESSAAIDAADYEVSRLVPLDLDGKDRMAREKSDIGCYVGK